MAEERPSDQLHASKSAPVHRAAQDIARAHGISIILEPDSQATRPPPIKHASTPAFQSPIRHHQRTPSRSKGVKETLDARSHYGSADDGDGPSVHRINQYVIKQEIGRGSFGSVHLAEDQYGMEFAVKEFSKARLRKRAQSNLLRKPNQGRGPGNITAAHGFNLPLHRHSSSQLDSADANNSLNLIKEEIAIMKKLDHNNLVSLIEVLDDPQEDSLYMVLEMCKKGVAMKVGLDERAEPYDDETCRCWFRDMILGIEYLHAQGIIHRDIKPDNCLITDDDVLKIVDFGVSEMFEKQSEMATAKSAGSPAFMPPELCVARHGQVSGRAADIWSMGVTLYCLRYGHIPFEKDNMLELYDSIREDDVPLDEESDAAFADLMRRMLQKEPEKRISMDELREHPWVTKHGTDTLLSAEENCADLVEPPTEAEMNHAITGNMSRVLAVVGAVKRFKDLVHDKRGRMMEGIFGTNSKIVAPPQSMRTGTRSQETHDRRPMDQILVTEGLHRPIDVDDDLERLPRDFDRVDIHRNDQSALDSAKSERRPGETEGRYKQRMETLKHQPSFGQNPEEHRKPLAGRSSTFPLAEHGKGHAHDPLEDKFFLNIGHDPDDVPEDPSELDNPIVSESPPAVEMDIYEQAYQDEMEKIMARRGRQPSMYLTRRIDHREDIRALSSIKDASKNAARAAAATFEDLYTRGYVASEAGRNAARAAAGRFSDKFGSAEQSTSGEGAGSWRQYAWSAAYDGLDFSKGAAKNASEKLGGLYNTYSQSGTKRSGLSNLVAQAQAKARGNESADPEIVDSPTDVGDSLMPTENSSSKASAPTSITPSAEDNDIAPPRTAGGNTANNPSDSFGTKSS